MSHSQPLVEEDIGICGDNFLTAHLNHVAVIELIPLAFVLAIRCVMPAVEATMVVDDSI